MKKAKYLCGMLMLTLIAGLSISLVGCGHEHVMIHHDGLKPTCEEDGIVEYWECSDCGKLYLDEKAKTEVSENNLAVPALGHDYVLIYDATNYVYNNVCQNDKSHVVKVADAGESEDFAYQIDSAKTMTEVMSRVSDTKVYLKLTEDLTMDIVIEEGEDVVIDLNGKKVTNVENHTILNKGNLTLTDSTDYKGLVDNVTHQKAAVFNEVGATLLIEGGTYTRSLENGKNEASSGGNSFYVILNHGDATIEDGHIKNDGAYSSLVENGWYSPNQNTSGVFSNLTVKGGIFEGGLYTLKNDDYGVMTIDGGLFQNKMPNSTVERATGIILNWNELTINGGNFVANECKMVVMTGYKGNDTYEKSYTKISGGILTGNITGTQAYVMYTSQSYENGTVDGNLVEKGFVVGQ